MIFVNRKFFECDVSAWIKLLWSHCRVVLFCNFTKIIGVFLKVLRKCKSQTIVSSTSTGSSESSDNISLDGDYGDVDIGSIEPYQDENMASDRSGAESESDNDDPDNIARHDVEQRFERPISV